MNVILSVLVISLLAVIAWIDNKTMEIPDTCNIALIICGMISIFVEPEISVFARLIGAICVSVPMYCVTRLIPEAFGGGDMKLTFAMGLYLGWKMILVGTFLAFLFGGSYAMYLLVSGKVKTGEGAHMAFGPALCLGFFFAEVWGNELLAWYWQLFI